jgi:hypothetical protein
MTAKTSAARKFAAHHNDDVKRTFEKATVATEETVRRVEDAVENTYSRAAQGTIEFHQKVLAITHANVDAAFDCARAVKIGTRSLGQCQITAHRGNMDDCSVRAFALKPRAFGAPLGGVGA